VREDLLHDLATWPLALEGGAHRQTRLPRNTGHEENGSESCDYERSGTAQRIAENQRKQKSEAKRLHRLARRKAKPKQTAAVS
jgi:hypothetical protein